MARARAPRRARRSAFALLVLSPLLALLPFLLGLHPSGASAVPFWNMVGSGALLTVLAAAGVAQVVTRS